MKKKLIFITEALWIGGIETALVNLLNRLDYDRYDVTCLILRDEQDMAARITPRCRFIVSDRRRAVSFKEPYRYNCIYTLMEEPQNASKFRRLIWHALVLLLRAPEAKLYASYVKRQIGREHFDTAIIYSDRTAETAVRAINADKFLMFYHHGAMRKEYHDTYGYRKSEHIIAVSDALAQKLRAYRHRYKEKIISVNNLIDIDGVRAKSLESPEIYFPKDRFNIVSCGRLSPAKGMDLAINACSLLTKNGCTNISWWIVGGGPEESALRELIREKNLEEYVTMLGMQSNPYPYIKQADLYVQPSRIESFGLTITEALVLGKPVISTKTDGGTELISDRENGLLCDVSSESIAAKVKLLIENPQLREHLADNAAAIDFEMRNNNVIRRLYMELD